jgi:uncharacterized coiled-coil DUF342 family protein
LRNARKRFKEQEAAKQAQSEAKEIPGDPFSDPFWDLYNRDGGISWEQSRRLPKSAQDKFKKGEIITLDELLKRMAGS